MSDTRIREPFPYLRAVVVVVVGCVVVAALAVADGCRRIWRRATR